MTRSLTVGALAAMAVGCGSGIPWHVENKPAAWADGEWQQNAKDCGAHFQVKTDGDTMYVAAQSCVYAVKAGGAKVWIANNLSDGPRYLAVGEGKVVVTSYSIGEKSHDTDSSGSNLNKRENGHLTAFNAADGTQLWDVAFDKEGSKLSAPAIAGGKALVYSKNSVNAYDLNSHEQVWSATPAGDNSILNVVPYPRITPVVSDGKVYAAALNASEIYDLATGKKMGDDTYSGGNIAGNVAAQPGAFIASRSKRSLTKSKGSMINMDGKNEVFAVDAKRDGYHRLWSTTLDYEGSDLGIANLAVNDGMIFACTNERVVGLDAASGSQKWEVKGHPVHPSSKRHGTRATASGTFTLDLAKGYVLNDSPDTGFAAFGGKVYVPAKFVEEVNGKKGRDVVTALDAKTGAYLGSWDGGGQTVLDIGPSPDGALVVATNNGLTTVKPDAFVPVAAAK